MAITTHATNGKTFEELDEAIARAKKEGQKHMRFILATSDEDFEIGAETKRLG